MPSPTSPDFDEFYVASRRRLMLQTFALTGDLAAARAAVRDAFVAARHHWRKVSRLADPEDWVRPRAWATAQRRTAGRIWHREKGLDDRQRAVIEALQKLPDVQRKTLLLTHLASMSMAEIGREIGETRQRAEQYLQLATASVSMALECASTAIRNQLDLLVPVVASPGLPRATVIRRRGLRRQRWHAVLGSLVVVALTLGAGAFVVADGHPQEARQPRVKAVTRSMLLDVAQVQPISSDQAWTMTATSDNTEGTGINSVCQSSRFADPRGLETLVRKFRTAGKPMQTLVQTVETSATPRAAARAYETTLGWFAGCSRARLQLVSAYRLGGLGERAQALKLRIPGKERRTYVVGLARTGSLTTSTVLTTMGEPARVAPVVQALTSSVQNLCASPAVKECRAAQPQITPVLPPPSGEMPGMLAVADLPPVGRINRPWVGTDPVPAVPNLAATTCDHTSFAKAGALHPLSRTFLIPGARLPQRFGITETSGRLPTRSAAQAFVKKVADKMATCEKRHMGSRVDHHVTVLDGWHDSSYLLWHLTTQINDKKATVDYWMGIVRVGRYAAQVNFAPAAGNDIDRATFRDLVVRARDRLFEVAR